MASAALPRARDAFWDSGIATGLAAPALFSLGGVMIKALHGRIPVLEICLFRSAIAWAGSVALSAATGASPMWGHRRNAAMLVLRGVAGTLSIACNYTAINLIPFGDAVALGMCKPCFVALCAYLLLGERLGPSRCAGLAVSLAGVLFVARPPFLFDGGGGGGGGGGWSHARTIGTLGALGHSTFAAGVAYAIRRIGKSEAAVTVALAFHSCTLVLSTPLAASWPEPAVLPTHREAWCLCVIAAASFTAQIFLTRSFQLLPAARASALSFTSVVFAMALGWLVFAERPAATSVAGSVVILAGVLLTTRGEGGGGGGGGGGGKDSDESGGGKAGADGRAGDEEAPLLDAQPPPRRGEGQPGVALGVLAEAPAEAPAAAGADAARKH